MILIATTNYYTVQLFMGHPSKHIASPSAVLLCFPGSANSLPPSSSSSSLSSSVSVLPPSLSLSSSLFSSFYEQRVIIARLRGRSPFSMQRRRQGVLHEHWTIEDWRRVTWTDESYVRTTGVPGLRISDKVPYIQPQSSCITPSMQPCQLAVD
ncbi:MAG: hypothetical protein JWM47_4449 [Acidimicrobiales bacterium]|nr:hypothetical protein [Acidimicrobiales bacterium]